MDILDLIDQIKDGGPEAQSLIDVLTDLLRADGKSQFIRDSEHAIQTRVLANGIPVINDINSVGRDVIGEGHFDTFNFMGGGGTAVAATELDSNVGGGAAASPKTLQTLVAAPTATMLVVSIFTGNNSVGTDTSASAVTYNGTPMTQLGEAVQTEGTEQLYGEVWYLANPTIVAGANISATFASLGRTTWISHQIFHGTYTSAPLLHIAKGVKATTPSMTVTDAGTNGAVFVSCGIRGAVGSAPDIQDFSPPCTDASLGSGGEFSVYNGYSIGNATITGQAITGTPASASMPWIILGASMPETTSAQGNFTLYVNKDNPRQVDITAASGAGSDCMFDYLVSSCFASLSGFSEGQTFTSLSGCSFKGYSTVQGAAAAISALSANQDPVLYICPGTYTENVTFTGPATNTVHIIGAGRIATTITGQTSGGTTLSHTTTSTTFFILENLRINVHNSAGAIGIGDVGGSSNWLVRNVQINTSANTSSIGVFTGVAAAATPWRFEQCLFSGSGSGFADSGPGSTGVVWGNVICQNCSFTVATGVWFANDNNFTAINCNFTGTTGIKNDAGQTVDGLKLDRCFFNGCTTGILASAGGGYRRSQIENSRFENCTKAIDFGTVANASTADCIIGNVFVTATGSDIAIDDTSGQLSLSVIIGNTFVGYNANNELIGLDTSDNTIGHNETDSGATLPDTHTTSGSGPAAPSTGKFVTYATDTTLTANRVLAPISAYTSVGGVGFIDAGTDDGAITATLKDLTANWTQAGVFDISTAGNLTVLKHAAIGASSVISTANLLQIAETLDATALGLAINSVNISAIAKLTSGTNAQAVNGTTSLIGINANGSGAMVQSGFVSGVLGKTSATFTAGTSLVINNAASFHADASVVANTTITNRFGFYADDTTGISGTVTTQYGFYVPALSKGGTNWAFYAVSNPSFFGGAVTYGGVSAPATPASDSVVVYEETGTDFLKAKDDNGAVYNLTHSHLVSCVVDGTVTNQKTAIGPMPNAGTIVSSKAKTCDAVTIGATAWVGNCYLVPAANVDTDGGTSTIYSTAPSITNGHMVSTNDALSTTTFAAGDYFVFATTTVGTSATMVEMSLKVRYT